MKQILSFWKENIMKTLIKKPLSRMSSRTFQKNSHYFSKFINFKIDNFHKYIFMPPQHHKNKMPS